MTKEKDVEGVAGNETLALKLNVISIDENKDKEALILPWRDSVKQVRLGSKPLTIKLG